MAGLVALLALMLGAHAAPAPRDTASGPPVAPAAQVRHPAIAVPVSPSDAKLLGQRIMVGFPGTSAGSGLLAQVRRGQVGSVILFGANITSRRQLTGLIGSLQRAARQGGNSPLLIAVDQEGGQVKRLPGGPPDLSPPQVAATGSTTVAAREGRATGLYLKGLGINMDLAPVSDVPTFQGAFIWQQGRAFSFRPGDVARYASAFALGLQAQHVAATAKHFPGVGSAAVDTDFKLDELHPTAAQLQGALLPYQTLIPRGLDAVMLSTAGFRAYDPAGTSTALSRPTVQHLLRGKLAFRGVTITDALGTPTGHDEITAGRLAARAGADILLYTDSAPGELAALEQDLAHGRLSRAEAIASYQRIVGLKRRVGGG